MKIKCNVTLLFQKTESGETKLAEYKSKTSFNKKKDPDTSKSDVKSKAFQNYKPLNPLQSKI